MIFLHVFSCRKITSIYLVYFWETSWHFQLPLCTDRITSPEALKHITATDRCAQTHTFVAARPVSSGSPLSKSRPWATHSFWRPPPLKVHPTCQSRQKNVNITLQYTLHVLRREGNMTLIASGSLHLEMSSLREVGKKKISAFPFSGHELCCHCCRIDRFLLYHWQLWMLSCVGLTRE